MPSNTDTLLPCPFCGNAAFSYAMDGGYVAECEGCACRTSICDSRGVEVETWNTRPPTDVPTDELMGLIEALDPHRYIEGIGSRKWIDACHNMAPHAYKLRDHLKAQASRIAELEGALAPFAAMGRVMEIRATVTFGKMPPDSEIVCESSGEAGIGILTMGHFRDAAAMIPDAPGWGGIYQPPFDRKALGDKTP